MNLPSRIIPNRGVTTPKSQSQRPKSLYSRDQFVKRNNNGNLHCPSGSMVNMPWGTASSDAKKDMYLDPNYRQSIIELGEVTAQLGEVGSAIGYFRRAQQIENDAGIEQRLYNLLLEYASQVLDKKTANTTLKVQKCRGKFINTDHVFTQSPRPTTATIRPYHSLINTKCLEKCSIYQQHFIISVNYIVDNQLSKAIDELEHCMVKENEDKIYALILRGKVFWSIGLVNESSRDLREACIMNSERQEVQEMLKVIADKANYFHSLTVRFHFEKDKQKAFYFSNKAIQIDPKNATFLLFRSFLYRIEENFEKALEDIETAAKHMREEDLALKLKVHEQLAVTYNDMGISCMKKNKFTEAVFIFKEALRFSTKDWGIFTNRGDCFRRLKKPEEALADYYRAQEQGGERKELNQRMALALYDMSTVHFNKQNYSACIELLDRAIQLDPDNSMIISLKSKCYVHTSDTRSAYQTLKPAIERNASNKSLALSINLITTQVSPRSTARTIKSPRLQEIFSARSNSNRKSFVFT